MLARLVQALTGEFEHHVISLTGDGAVGGDLRSLGTPLHLLDVKRGPAALAGLWTLPPLLRQVGPDLVQTWLCHADLLGGIAGRWGLACPIVWGVHQADFETPEQPLSTRLVQRACCRLSTHIPERIVFCSAAGLRSRVAAGYPPGRCVMIPNGVDEMRFRPDEEARARLRSELGIAHDALVLAVPARWHPDKDPHSFFSAADILLQRYPKVRFLLFGDGMSDENTELRVLVEASRAPTAFLTVGFRRDVAALFAASDAALLSSRTEAFPNVVVEGMACGVPFAATAVGDVAEIVGDAGQVVPRGEPFALAQAAASLIELDPEARRALGQSARERVVSRFSLAATASLYRDLYHALISERIAAR